MKIQARAEAAIDPSNESIKGQILSMIAKLKDELVELEEAFESLSTRSQHSEERFVEFALNFAKNMGASFLDPNLSEVNRKRCKQIIFPGGFRLDENKNVYTPEISRLIRLTSKKKDAEASDNSHLVQHS